ncbi:hypothetical protein L345_17078, partial [Ophiophagus hannah]
MEHWMERFSGCRALVMGAGQGAMNAKGIHQLWMLFSLAWLVLEMDAASFEQFKKKHVDYPMNLPESYNNYCNQMMMSRGMKYRYYNTFINASDYTLKHICSKYDDGPWISDN